MEIDKNTPTGEYATFRQHLDAVLRTEDVQQVRAFLISQGQWHDDVPADPEFAMWMMVIGSSTLSDMHERARAWLVAHGHEAEAEMLLGKRKQQMNPKRNRSPQKRQTTVKRKKTQ